MVTGEGESGAITSCKLSTKEGGGGGRGKLGFMLINITAYGRAQLGLLSAQYSLLAPLLIKYLLGNS